MNSELSGKISQLIKRILQSTVLKGAAIYTSANFTSTAIPFFLLPVMTRYLTPEDYGITATFGVLLGICASFINLSTPLFINIKYFKIPENEFPQYVSNCLLLTAINCLIVTILFTVFASEIEKTSLFPGHWLYAVSIICFCGNITLTLLVILRLTFKPRQYFAMYFFQTVLDMGLSVWFVVGMGMNWQGRIIAVIIATMVFAVISIILLYKNNWIVFKYSIMYIKEAVKFGAPLLSSSMTMFILSSADRLIIAKVIGLAELGLYSVGFQFAMIITIAINSFNQAYSTWLFDKLNTATNQLKSKIVFLSYGQMLALLIAAIIISYILPIIIELFVGAKFYGAVQIIFWAVLAQAFFGMDVIMGNFINYAERTRLFFTVDVFVSLFHLAACYLLVNENGIVGAAQAIALSRFIRFLLIWIMSNKAYPMPWLSFYKSSRL